MIIIFHSQQLKINNKPNYVLIGIIVSIVVISIILLTIYGISKYKQSKQQIAPENKEIDEILPYKYKNINEYGYINNKETYEANIIKIKELIKNIHEENILLYYNEESNYILFIRNNKKDNHFLLYYQFNNYNYTAIIQLYIKYLSIDNNNKLLYYKNCKEVVFFQHNNNFTIEDVKIYKDIIIKKIIFIKQNYINQINNNNNNFVYFYIKYNKETSKQDKYLYFIFK